MIKKKIDTQSIFVQLPTFAMTEPAEQNDNNQMTALLPQQSSAFSLPKIEQPPVIARNAWGASGDDYEAESFESYSDDEGGTAASSNDTWLIQRVCVLHTPHTHAPDHTAHTTLHHTIPHSYTRRTSTSTASNACTTQYKKIHPTVPLGK